MRLLAPLLAAAAAAAAGLTTHAHAAALPAERAQQQQQQHVFSAGGGGSALRAAPGPVSTTRSYAIKDYMAGQPSWVAPPGQQATNLSQADAQRYSDAARARKAPVHRTYTGASADGNAFPFINLAAGGAPDGGQNGTTCMPAQPPAQLDGWWADPASEYAFLGFSYETSACQGPAQMWREFLDIKARFNGRYVRIYGTCDKDGFWDQIVDTAWQVGLGVHALVWFGFNGDTSYIGRRDQLAQTLMSNPRAPYVVRLVQFGTEPLFDDVLPVTELYSEIVRFQQILSDPAVAINVTISELAYGYQETQSAGSYFLFGILDSFNVHQLPYFAGDASTGNKAWHDLMNDNSFYQQHAGGKQIIWDQCGWPSEHYPGVEPNSPNAVSDVPNEQLFFTLLEHNCAWMKANAVGWTMHIYSDAQEPGYGYYDTAGRPKFAPFQPALFC